MRKRKYENKGKSATRSAFAELRKTLDRLERKVNEGIDREDADWAKLVDKGIVNFEAEHELKQCLTMALDLIFIRVKDKTDDDSKYIKNIIIKARKGSAK